MADTIRSVPLSIALYLVVFFSLYIALAKSFVAPYLALELGGAAMSFGDSGSLCWMSFAAAALAGTRWARRGNLGLAILAAVLAPICAAGFCVLGYSLLATSYVGLLLMVIAVLSFALARFPLRAGWLSSAGLSASVTMIASLLVFVGMTVGALSVQTLPEVEGAADWHQVRAIALNEAETLGIGDVELRVAPLPKNETASYGHSQGTITVSTSSIQGAETTEELTEGVLHALAHCSQARSPEAWPDLNPSDIEAWLAVADGACPPRADDEAAAGSAFTQIEVQAADWAREHSAQTMND